MFNLEERRSFLKRSILAIGVALVAPTTNVFAAGTISGISTTKSKSGLVVRWKSYSGAYKYKVYYKFDSASSWSTNSSTIGNMAALVKYGWKNCKVYVVAYTKYGSTLARSSTYTYFYSGSGNVNNGGNLNVKQLGAPTWTDASASGTKITLKWNSVKNAASYTIFYKKNSASSYTALKSGLKTTSYSFTGTKGTTYTFYLYAAPQTGYKQSKPSETRTVTIPKTTTKKLAAPTWKSSPVSGTKVTLNWNSVANAGSYALYYNCGSSKGVKVSTSIKKTSYTFTGKAGQTYEFYLYANSSKSGYSKSNASATRTVKIAGKKLGTPTFELCVGKSNQIKVIVAANSSDYKKYVVPRVYAIQYRKSGASSWKTVYIEAAAKNNYPIGVGGWMDLTPNYGCYVLKGLTNNATYQFRVKAFACSDLRNKGYANSNWSSTKSAKVKKGSYWGYGGSYTPTFVDYNVSRNSYAINF